MADDEVAHGTLAGHRQCKLRKVGTCALCADAEKANREMDPDAGAVLRPVVPAVKRTVPPAVKRKRGRGSRVIDTSAAGPPAKDDQVGIVAPLAARVVLTVEGIIDQLNELRPPTPGAGANCA